MKKIITACICLFLLLSCSSSTEEVAMDQNELGTWRLIEVLADPGDGSGTFQPVISSKTVTFETNGTVRCLGNLCNLSIASSPQTTGTYSRNTRSITTSNCNQLQLTYEITADELIINYPFIETCKSKYVRAQ
jgi:heat shock protein HslJ